MSLPFSQFPDEKTPISEIYQKLGYDVLNISASDSTSAEKGKELVHKGYSYKATGKRSRKLSKFFVCSSCHNVVKEFENPAEINSEKKLEYARKNNIAYLQASTFYGIYNRQSFFNDDYQNLFSEKPGVDKANKDLKAAVQFCQQNMMQGNKLENWELESILLYFKEIEYKLEDLKLSETEKKQLGEALKGNFDKKLAFNLLKSKYATFYPAHFLKIPKFKVPEKTLSRDIKRLEEGKALFELSCLHCHKNKRYSFFGLDSDRLTFKALEKATRTENYIFSMFFLVREGLPPRMGHRSHMPAFSSEKLSASQLESLYLYVNAKAKNIY